MSLPPTGFAYATALSVDQAPDSRTRVAELRRRIRAAEGDVDDLDNINYIG